MFVIAKINTGLVTSSQTYTIHQVFRLEKIAIQDLCVKDDDSKCAFEILTAKRFSLSLFLFLFLSLSFWSNRAYAFVVDHEAEKRVWLEELQLAIYAIHMSLGIQNLPGWQHNVVRYILYIMCFMSHFFRYVVFPFHFSLYLYIVWTINKYRIIM